MADTTDTVKVCPVQSDNSALWASLMNQQNNPAEMMALMNGNGMNNWMNNPWIYFVFLAMFGGGNIFGNRTDAAQNADLSRQLQTLQGTVADNHNNDLALQAINGNRDALGQLAQTFNSDLNSITSAVASVQSAIQSVGGQVGYSAESVKNAIALGDSNIVSKMQECCCANKLLITEQGYQNQLATERQTGILGGKIDNFQSANQLGQFQMQSALGNQVNDVKNALINGFAQVGYATQAQTAQIVEAGNANTQRILDQMCANSTQALRDQLADKDRQLQTQTILNQINGGCGCNS